MESLAFFLAKISNLAQKNFQNGSNMCFFFFWGGTFSSCQSFSQFFFEKKCPDFSIGFF
jgi:hypothetical protein